VLSAIDQAISGWMAGRYRPGRSRARGCLEIRSSDKPSDNGSGQRPTRRDVPRQRHPSEMR